MPTEAAISVSELNRKARALLERGMARLWVEGEPKHRALWEAKMALQARGFPARDWAGWVMTGR